MSSICALLKGSKTSSINLSPLGFVFGFPVVLICCSLIACVASSVCLLLKATPLEKLSALFLNAFA